jgi:hypothetical protein
MTPEEMGVWGLFFGIIGFIATVVLTGVVIGLDRKRRSKEEEYYISQTKKNVKKISDIFRDVITISSGKSKGTWEEQELEDITYQLKDYFIENYQHCRYLIDNTEMCLAKWQSLDAKQKQNIQEIIDSLGWLIETYFPTGLSIPTYKRIWTQHYHDLDSKNIRVNEILNTITIKS